MIRFKHITLLSSLAALLLVTALPCLAAPAAQQNVCIQCHGGLDGRLQEPVMQWRQSIHAANGITCNGCHGGDPNDAANAMNPDRGFLGKPVAAAIPSFCGRCHVGVLKEYQASQHARQPGTVGPTCVTCHGNHRVLKASIDLISEKSCSRCHSYERARAIKEAMAGLEERLVRLEGQIATVKGMGVDTDRLEKTLFSTRNRLHTLFHQLDVGRVQSETAGIAKDIDGIDRDLQGIDQQQRTRKLAGAAAIGAALLAALLLRLYLKTYER